MCFPHAHLPFVRGPTNEPKMGRRKRRSSSARLTSFRINGTRWQYWRLTLSLFSCYFHGQCALFACTWGQWYPCLTLVYHHGLGCGSKEDPLSLGCGVQGRESCSRPGTSPPPPFCSPIILSLIGSWYGEGASD